MSEAPTAQVPVGAPRWGRSLVLYGATLAAIAALAAAWIASRPTPSYEQGPGSTAISMTDYGFSPNDMTWRVGERVRLTLDNDSEANPGKTHEFMMGRSPVMGATAFGPRPIGGFQTDFFDGVEVQIVRATGLQMAMPGKAMLSQPQTQSAGMGGMQMGGQQMQGMQMGGGQQMGGMQGMQMGGDNGFMLMLDPGGSVTFSFVVPRKPGRWEFGCFQQTGEHWTNGMRGRVTVRPA